jgi:hypothetical protein
VAAGVALLSFFGDTAGRVTAVGVCMYVWMAMVLSVLRLDGEVDC